MSSTQTAFLRGERPDDVAIYVANEYADTDALAAHGDRLDGGVVVVLPGAEGRELFEGLTGVETMQFAQAAGRTSGTVDADLAGGVCPDGPGEAHMVQFLLAFVQPETPEAGGSYAEGDVLHAYAACACGTTYADRWVLD